MADNISRPVASTSLPQAPTSNVSVRNIAAGGEAIARAGADIFDAATVWGQHRDEADVAAASASALEQIDQYEAELETADDPAKIRDGAEKRIAEIQSSAGAGIRSQAAQEAFQQRFGQAARAARVRVRQRAAKLEIDQGVASVERGLTALNGQAARAGSLAQRQILIDQAHAQLDGARSAGWISAVEAEKRKQDFAGGVDTDAALRLVTENPAAASRALAPDAGFFPHLDERSRIRLKHSADTELKRQAAERRAEAARARQDAKIDASLALQDLRTIVNSGAPVDPAVMREVDTLVRRAGDLRLSRSYADAVDRSRLNADIAGMSPDDLKARREQLRQGIAAGADAAEVEALAVVDGALKPYLAAERAFAEDQSTRRLDDAEAILKAGRALPPGTLESLAPLVQASGSAALGRRFDKVAEDARIGDTVASLSLADLRAQAAALEQGRVATGGQVRALDAVKDALKPIDAAEKAAAEDKAARGLDDLEDVVKAGRPLERGALDALAPAVIASGSAALERRFDKLVERAAVNKVVGALTIQELRDQAAAIEAAPAATGTDVRLLDAINAALKPVDAAGAAAAQDRATRGLDDLDDAIAAGKPILPGALAALAPDVIASGDDALARRYDKLAEGADINRAVNALTPAQLDAEAAALRASTDAGGPGSDVRALQAIEKKLKPITAARQEEAARLKAQAADVATRGLDDVADVIAAGLGVGSDRWTEIATAVVASESDALARRYDDLVEKAKVAGAIEGRPPADLATIAAEIAEQIDPNAASPIRVRQVTAINDRLEKTEAAAVKDALKAYADGTRLRLPPVDWAGDAVEAALAQRAAVAAKAEDWHGQPSLLVTGGELKAIQHWFKKAQPLQQAALLATIAAVPGPAAQRTAEAVAGGDKAAYAAGALIRLGPQHQATAEAILQGSGAMREKLAVLPTDGVRADAWNKANGQCARPAGGRADPGALHGGGGSSVRGRSAVAGHQRRRPEKRRRRAPGRGRSAGRKPATGRRALEKQPGRLWRHRRGQRRANHPAAGRRRGRRGRRAGRARPDQHQRRVALRRAAGACDDFRPAAPGQSGPDPQHAAGERRGRHLPGL